MPQIIDKNTLKEMIRFDMFKAVEMSLKKLKEFEEKYKDESLYKSCKIEDVSHDAELLKWCTKALT